MNSLAAHVRRATAEAESAACETSAHCEMDGASSNHEGADILATRITETAEHGPAGLTVLELPIRGMDCADEAVEIEQAVGRLEGVTQVRALVSAARTTVTYDPALTSMERIREAIESTGCSVGEAAEATEPKQAGRSALVNVAGWSAMILVAAVVVLAAIVERVGLFESALSRLPWWVFAVAIALGGWHVFLGVARSALRAKVTSHTLMTAGVVASLAIGQWITAALIVFFMRFADWLEERTTERNRAALKELTALQPVMARLLRDGQEVEVALDALRSGDVMLVKPGERIPADGEIVEGQAAVDQAPITGESIPVDKQVGDRVFAATVAQGGFLKIRATQVGADTTFGRIVRLVEEAEAQKAPVQRFADRFAGYYMPLVLVMAVLAYLVTRQLVNAVAVLVVACACAIVLATPVVVLASVGNAARRGLLIKGGIVLEQLARVNTVVMDKTGTLTLGKPRVTDVVPLNGGEPATILRAAAAQSLPDVAIMLNSARLMRTRTTRT